MDSRGPLGPCFSGWHRTAQESALRVHSHAVTYGQSFTWLNPGHSELVSPASKPLCHWASPSLSRPVSKLTRLLYILLSTCYIAGACVGMWDTAVDEKQPCPVQRCSKRRQCSGTWGICMMFSEVGKSQGQAVRSKRGLGGEDRAYTVGLDGVPFNLPHWFRVSR